MTSMYLYGTTLGLMFAVVCDCNRPCLSVKTSKACYGSTPPCNKHALECSSGMIAIHDAYYTNSTACTAVGISNCNINVSSIPDTGRYRDFNETQLVNLYKNCSGQQSCTFNGDRKSTITFSIVKFICINDSCNICDQVNATTSDTSLLWSRSSGRIHTCTCTISTLQNNTNLYLTALDMRFNTTRQLCPGVTISVDGNSLPVNCSQLSPYQLLVNTLQQVQVTVNKGDADVNGVVWIRIQGSNTMRLICNEKLTATTDVVSTALPSSNSIKASSSTTDYIPTVKSATATETEASNTGTIVGVVIPCLLIITAMVLIAVFIVRRRWSNTAEKDNKTNPNAMGQEVYSLAVDVNPNECCEIEKGPAKSVDYGYARIKKITSNPSSKDQEVYCLAGGGHKNKYFEIQPSASKTSSTNYDNAGVPNTHASKKENLEPTNKQEKEDDYDHVGGKANDKNMIDNVYSYDHLNGKTTTENANNDHDVASRSSDYDTSASVQKRFDHATECREDEYGYNHLGNQVQKKTLHNDYDTSASAVTAVARLNSRTDEPDYDYVTKDPGGVPSPYDPGNIENGSDVYALAKEANNPYQLAK